MVASFLTITIPYLQQDYTAVTASLLTELVVIQRTAATNGNITAVPQSSITFNTQFSSSLRDIWLNGLWIASLVTTLTTAIASGLIKQWLQYYVKDISGANPKTRALTRQYRYTGLIRWGVPQIIEALPVLMNISIFLFFTGLVLLVEDLSDMNGVTWFVVGMTIVTFLTYAISSFVPIWNPQCPYKTSLSKFYNGIIRTILLSLLMWISFFSPNASILVARFKSLIKVEWKKVSSKPVDSENEGAGPITVDHGMTRMDTDVHRTTDLEASVSNREGGYSVAFAYSRRAFKQFVASLTQRITRIIPSPAPFLHGWPSSVLKHVRRFITPLQHPHKIIDSLISSGYGCSMKTLEGYLVEKYDVELHKDVITEMALISTNPSVSEVAFQSMSALTCLFGNDVQTVFRKGADDLIESLNERYERCFRRDLSYNYHFSVGFRVAERYTRALLTFPDHMSKTDHRELEAFSHHINLQTISVLARAISSKISWICASLAIITNQSYVR